VFSYRLYANATTQGKHDIGILDLFVDLVNSRAPPAKQTVTQVPHPTTSTFSASPTNVLISSSDFCSATIIIHSVNYC
jgi:hypothetical protein